MEIIKVENNQLQIQQDFIESYKAFQEQKAIMDIKEKEFKAELLKYMEANGIKSFETEGLRITYKAPSTRKTLDSNALKEQGLYDLFVKETQVKASVTISVD